MKYEEIGGYLIDTTNNNKINLKRYSIEIAINMLDSLEDCKDCIDCYGCKRCYKCKNCVNSHNCYECNSCFNCIDCYGCSYCRNCIDYNGNKEKPKPILYNNKYTFRDLLDNRDVFDPNYVEKNNILYNIIFSKYLVNQNINKNTNILAIYEREKSDIVELEKYPHWDMVAYGDFTNINTIFQSKYGINKVSQKELKTHHQKLLSMTYINQKIKYECKLPNHNYCKNICSNNKCEYKKIITILNDITPTKGKENENI